MTEKTKGVISLVVAAIAFGFIMVVVMDGDSSFLNLFIGDGFKITLFDQNNLTVEYTDTFENFGLIIVNLSRIQ
tara:strand:- start:49 stop:270 length:222 start_codon:yes stop_codon:yes gene_type:complete